MVWQFVVQSAGGRSEYSKFIVSIVALSGRSVSGEVFAMKLSLPFFQRLLDVDQGIFLCGERLAHDDLPAKEAREPRKALLY